MAERKKKNEAEISTRAFPLESPSKKFQCDKRFEPGVPDRQSSSLSFKPLDHRGFPASGWFDLSTISKTRLTLTPANQYIFSAESYNQYLLCVRITTYPRAV